MTIHCTPRSGTWMLAAFILFVGLSIHAAPQAELWPRWEAHAADSEETIDHSRWESFLDTYLETDTASGVNRVPYGRVSERDREALQGYISDLEAVRVSRLNRDAQMAYWLNLYNAVTVELILEHYPLDSIRDINISGPFYNRHPWNAELATVEGVELTLNDIEHRIIRPIWQDPRIHYAVNCASIGCPNLHPEPFTGDSYREVFDEAAREYVNHERGARFEDDSLHLSSIYDWYSEDWDDSMEVIVDHLLEYAEGSLERQLTEFAENGYSATVEYEYDWSLNVP